MKLIGKGIYFLRCLQPGEPIDPSQTKDDSVSFGEINEDSINILSNLINCVFKPQIKTMTDEEWDQCDENSRKEFNQYL
jgi:hypothetical protein